jgi:hypothetical protein
MDELIAVQGLRELIENPRKIPTQAKIFNGHHLLLFMQKMNWNDAKSYCESIGAHLATITTKAEMDWILKTFGPHWGCWLGGTDKDQEGVWTWVTGEKWQYSFWGKDEPNNAGGNENALEIFLTGYWNDGPIEYEKPFLIEWDR